MKTMKQCFLLVAATFLAANLYSLSDGAFNMTGAPGSGDCSGCHSGSIVNGDAKGSINIQVDNANGFYEPGKTYLVKVTVAYPGKNRFGFALTTRKQGETNWSGTFMADANSGVFNRTEFVAHRRASIDATSQKTWSFSWKAPDSANEDITLYAAGVVSNGDNNNTGDIVYTTKMVLKRNLTGVDDLPIQPEVIHIYPIPAYDEIKFSSTTQISFARLYNAKGEEVVAYKSSDLIQEQDAYHMMLPQGLSTGIYFLIANGEGKLLKGKVVIDN